MAISEELTAPVRESRNDLAAFERDVGDGHVALDFIVPTLHCAGCIAKIERHFQNHPDEVTARVNLGARRVHFEWPKARSNGSLIASELASLGFVGEPLLHSEQSITASERQLRKLMLCVGVAGFAAANVMLLSVSVWSGASGATRDLFHWISALIALPAIVYAGQPFFQSAYHSLRQRQVNMDVPISLAVILAGAVSLYETMTHGEHAFFDAAVTLLFFLLIGRTLDHVMRNKARASVNELLALQSKTAIVVNDKGEQTVIAARDVRPGMDILVRAGETVPVDGRIIAGCSDINWSMVTGESQPQTGDIGDKIYSGLINLTRPITVRTEQVGEETFLAEIVRLMEEAEARSPKYRKLADKAAEVYVPFVHAIALATFVGWLLAGAGWQQAMFIAVSVLIITCPCALGLAVPVVQITASGIAFKLGILMKEGTALERLAEVDTVALDKTGTMTFANPQMSRTLGVSHELHTAAVSLAKHSAHPLSMALAEAGKTAGIGFVKLTDITEHPGLGLEGYIEDQKVRLGTAEWCEVDDTGSPETADVMLWASIFNLGEKQSIGFCFEDQLKPGVDELVCKLADRGISVHILSGDRSQTVAALADKLSVDHFVGEMKPRDKQEYIEALNQRGAKVAMVGDGINDGPALEAAHVSLSPATATNVAQNSASFVIMGDSAAPIGSLFELAVQSRRLIWQNFALALLYNLIAVPIAVLGGATPVVAAIAMSLSSLIVTLNALRLNLLIKID